MYKLVVFFCLVAMAAAAPQVLLRSLGGLWGGHAFGGAVVPAPYAYHSGYSVIQHVEPVEQHGYHIAY